MSAIDLAFGIAWFALYMITNFLVIRYWPEKSPAVLAIVTAVVVTGASAALAAAVSLEANYWRVLATAWFLMLSYLMLFGATYKSVSLHILQDLWQAPSRKLPLEHILGRYIQEQSFEARIHVMLEHGWATQSPAGLVLSRKGRRLARAVRVVQRLYKIEKSG